MKKIFFLIILTLFTIDAFCCTSAIFTGRVTPDGRPMMWKNRDTDELNNRIEHFKGPRFDFIALVNSPDRGREAWAGANAAGFCIMNTASYNIHIIGDNSKEGDGEGRVMFKALGLCKTVADFERLLDTIKKPMAIEANFGVIDAEGGAAYFEVNNFKWIKRDVNNPLIAPEGYIVYTNFSYTGREDEGHGYIRHNNADFAIQQGLKNKDAFTPQWVFNNLSRSYYNSFIGADLYKSNITKESNGWFIDQDFIPRESTSAAVVFQGVKQGESGDNTIMWCAMSYPPISLAIPMFLKYPETLPDIMVKQTEAPSNCKMCDMVLALKYKEVFPVKRGSGYKYFKFSKVFNAEGTGYEQQLWPSENEIFKESEPVISLLRKGKLSKKDLETFNNKVSSIAINAYANLKN
jgi:hypothetical protein